MCTAACALTSRTRLHSVNTHAQAKVGRGRENMAWPNLPGFRGPLQDLVMTNQIADPA